MYRQRIHPFECCSGLCSFELSQLPIGRGGGLRCATLWGVCYVSWDHSTQCPGDLSLGVGVPVNIECRARTPRRWLHCYIECILYLYVILSKLMYRTSIQQAPLNALISWIIRSATQSPCHTGNFLVQLSWSSDFMKKFLESRVE